MDHHNSRVAQLIASRIANCGRPQCDIAREAGFEQPNVMTMIKQGRTKVPLGRIGPIAKALEIDPLVLLQMCMSEYHPETWNAIQPHLASAMTADEVLLIGNLRESVGAPYLSALDDESSEHLRRLLESLRRQVTPR